VTRVFAVKASARVALPVAAVLDLLRRRHHGLEPGQDRL